MPAAGAALGADASPVYLPAPRTTDGQAYTGSGTLGSVVLQSGSDAAAVRVYDGTDATGVLLCALAVSAANLSTDWLAPGGGVRFGTGLYVDLTGTSPAAVCYRR